MTDWLPAFLPTWRCGSLIACRPVPGTVSHGGNPPGDFMRLRIRSGATETSQRPFGSAGSEYPPFDSLALQAECPDRVRSRSAQDLSTSDSDLIHRRRCGWGSAASGSSPAWSPSVPAPAGELAPE